MIKNIDNKNSILAFCIGRGCKYNLNFAKTCYYKLKITNSIILNYISEAFIMHNFVEHVLIKITNPKILWNPITPNKETCKLLANAYSEKLKTPMVMVCIFNNWIDIFEHIKEGYDYSLSKKASELRRYDFVKYYKEEGSYADETTEIKSYPPTQEVLQNTTSIATI